MSLIVSGKSQGADFAPHPEGAYPARCVRIIDMGTQTKQFKGESSELHQIMFGFESSELMPDGEKKGLPFLISTKLTASLGPKANMRKLFESWRGRKFTPAEIEGFDLKNVLGKPCIIQVVHSEPNAQGKVYANIQNIMGLMPGMTVPPAKNELVFFSLSAFDKSVYDSLSDRLKEQIAQSPEYKALGVKAPAKAPASQAPAGDMEDADIPF
jgi:hypothetical protein